MKRWYSARLLFEAELEGQVTEDPLFEESIRLVEAEDDNEAQLKACEIGVQAQHEYLNEEGFVVRWRFRHLLELQDTCEFQIVHGVEVFSRLFRKSEVQE